MKKEWLYLLLVFGMSSCSRYYYKPNGVNAPMLTAANDLHLSANATNDVAFVNLQAAYSPVNHLGIIANISTYSYKADSPDVTAGNVDASAHLAELGVGYYYSTGNRAKLVYDIYGGIGNGSMKSDVNMSAVRGFIQPGVGIRTKYFEASFNYRLSCIRYYNLNTNGHDSNYLSQQHLINDNGRRIDNTAYLFAEPSITIRGGYKFIKVQMQYVIAKAVTNVPWAYNADQFSIGVGFELEELMHIINGSGDKSSNELNR